MAFCFNSHLEVDAEALTGHLIEERPTDGSDAK
jgi:hypothetical protein